MLLPSQGPVAQGLHAAYEKLTAKHGLKGSIPLYQERGVYNFYLRMDGGQAGVQPSAGSQKDSTKGTQIGATAVPEGKHPNGRQGRHP